MPPKGSGRGRKKLVQEKKAKTAENNIESYFSPSKNKPETLENSSLLNGKIETEDNEKTEEIVDKQVTKPGVKRGKLDAAEDISGNAEKDFVVDSSPTDIVAAPKRGRKKLNQEVSKQTESNIKESEEQVNGEDLDSLNAKKLIEKKEEIEDKSLTKESETKPSGKRGRKKLTKEVDEITESNLENNSKEQVEGDDPGTLNVKKTESTKEIEDKSLTEEVESNESKTKGKRGRKKIFPIVNKVLDADSNKKVVENSEEIKNENLKKKDANKNEVETKRGKRGRKKNIAATSDESKTSESSVVKVKSEESKNKEEVNTSPVKAGRKRKNDTAVLPEKETKRNKAVEKNLSDTDTVEEDRILKVALKRSKSIEELISKNSDKIKEKGKDAKKPATKRKMGADTDTSDSGTKPAKKLKGETKSKGQSKNDKMPDVTILDFSNTSTSPTGKTWNMKLASWNVNGVRAWLEKDGLIYLKHESPDIMCIQETKCSDDKLPAEVNVDGYHSYWLAGDRDGYSGVGLLSKKKPLSVKYGIDIKEHDTEGRVITAEYDEFFLITAYVPNAGRGLVRLDYRIQWDKDFRSYIKSLDEKKPIVLCGDLNVAHEEIDLSNPKSNKKNAGFTKEEREGFTTLLSEGFIDTFRHLYPDQKAAYTFWSYMMNARAKNVGWRLDYFVVSKRLVDNLCDNVIRKDVFGSDHCPIALFISI